MRNKAVRIGKPTFFYEFGGTVHKASIETVAKQVRMGWRLRAKAQCLSEYPDEAKLDASRTIFTGKIKEVEARKGAWIIRTEGIDYLYL